MTIRQSLIGQVCLVVGTAAYSLAVKSTLPEIVPIHWNAAGKPDGYGHAAVNLWLMPGVLAFMMLLTWGLPKLSPRQFEITRFETTYAILMLLASMLMSALHVMILVATRSASFELRGGGIMAVIGAFFAIFGLFIGNVKRNFYVGIRTPWTLASEKVWNETHRQAGPLWFYGGVVVALLSLVGAPLGVSIGVLVVVVLVPVVNSFRLSRRLET